MSRPYPTLNPSHSSSAHLGTCELELSTDLKFQTYVQAHYIIIIIIKYEIKMPFRFVNLSRRAELGLLISSQIRAFTWPRVNRSRII